MSKDNKFYDEESYNKGLFDARQGIFDEHLKLRSSRLKKPKSDKYDPKEVALKQEIDIIYKNVCVLIEENGDLIEVIEKVIVNQLLHKVILLLISGLSIFSLVLLLLKS